MANEIIRLSINGHQHAFHSVNLHYVKFQPILKLGNLPHLQT